MEKLSNSLLSFAVDRWFSNTRVVTPGLLVAIFFVAYLIVLA
jgi:hypothetical protein